LLLNAFKAPSFYVAPEVLAKLLKDFTEILGVTSADVNNHTLLEFTHLR
jgi:hypothetical protein